MSEEKRPEGAGPPAPSNTGAGAPAPSDTGAAPAATGVPALGDHPETPPTETHYAPGIDDGYGYHDDPYSYDESGYRYGESTQAPEQQQAAETPVAVAEVKPETAVAIAPKPAPLAKAGGNSPPPKPPPPVDPEDEEDDGMLRMSFLEHLEELRTRIIRSLMGFAGSFLLTLVFANELWRIISDPAIVALRNLGYKPAQLVAISPMEQFSTIWVKAPMVVSLFLASPIVLYQVWGFISPGLYKRERRWAVPFILCTSGLFITGGLFAYFVVFRFGLEFLLGVGKDANVAAMVTISEYFDLFVNVTLGVAIVFELPVLIFFLTLIRIASPRFLISHSRYAILCIMLLAAVITPTPDVFNLMLFAVPMMLLYFVGVFASYLLELNREGKRFPWKWIYLSLFVLLALTGGAVWLAVAKFGWKLLPHWPFLTK